MILEYNEEFNIVLSLERVSFLQKKASIPFIKSISKNVKWLYYSFAIFLFIALICLMLFFFRNEDPNFLGSSVIFFIASALSFVVYKSNLSFPKSIDKDNILGIEKNISTFILTKNTITIEYYDERKKKDSLNLFFSDKKILLRAYNILKDWYEHTSI